MEKCVYCDKRATGMDALGLAACAGHVHEADEYYEQRTGRDPNVDPMLWCDEHLDNWQPGCERCEVCSQHHYGKGVAEAREGGEIFLEAVRFDKPEEMADFLGVLVAADHPRSCTCDSCREFWRIVGPEEDGHYGPFGKAID